MTWDDLDLYYGHKAQEMILTDVSDTIHADLLASFALNIEILLADVTKPEKSKILTLTWPVTSSVTSRSTFSPCTGSSRTGLSNGVWNLEIDPVVWEISGGGGPLAPPPAGRVTNQTLAGRGLTPDRSVLERPSYRIQDCYRQGIAEISTDQCCRTVDHYRHFRFLSFLFTHFFKVPPKLVKWVELAETFTRHFSQPWDKLKQKWDEYTQNCVFYSRFLG